MTDEEIVDFLQGATTVVLTTLDATGWPHSTAMWFVLDEEGSLRMWTYGKSQKVKNLRRDPRAALLAEDGRTYDELRGVLVRGHVEVIEDFVEVRSIGLALHQRYVVPSAPEAAEDSLVLPEIERQAAKRVGLVLPLERVASWDHRKL